MFSARTLACGEAFGSRAGVKGGAPPVKAGMGGCSPSRQISRLFSQGSSREPVHQVNNVSPASSKSNHQSSHNHSGNSASDWTEDSADKLQEAVDRIFGGAAGKSLLGLDFSFTIADPGLDGCPLIGCSRGFTKLCGYEVNEIVGRNCRFLVDPVPQEQVDAKMRRQTKEFCESVRCGKDYRRPSKDRESWMPTGRPADEFLAMQRNARKDGSLFNNMFLLKVVDLSNELGKETPYIVALQSELPDGKADLEKVTKNLEELDARMSRVRRELAGMFFMRSAISRQLHTSFPPPLPEGGDVAPRQLHSAFTASEVERWKEGQFTKVKKVADATRNGGTVWLMKDKAEQMYAVKQMPNSWIRTSHEEFLKVHPRESELPWQDIGCTRFLNSVNFAYACNLRGVFRSDEHTYVVSQFASEGDLFSAAEAGEPPGPKREAGFMPIVLEFFSALKHLHDMGIVHRDISLENVLRTKTSEGKFTIKIIDYGMASTGRLFSNCPRGKASYEAPDMQGDGEYDAFLSDGFAAGVVVYAMFVKDYPWLSTKPGRCKCFDYVRQEGFRAYCSRRCVRGSNKRIADCISELLLQMLDGMLTIDPSKRLTLGENDWNGRRSVWDEPWLKNQRLLPGYASM